MSIKLQPWKQNKESKDRRWRNLQFNLDTSVANLLAGMHEIKSCIDSTWTRICNEMLIARRNNAAYFSSPTESTKGTPTYSPEPPKRIQEGNKDKKFHKRYISFISSKMHFFDRHFGKQCDKSANVEGCSPLPPSTPIEKSWLRDCARAIRGIHSLSPLGLLFPVLWRA